MKAASLPYCESTVVLTGTLDRIGMSTTSGLHFCEIIIEPTRKKQRVHLPDAMGFEVCEEQPPRKPDEVWLISRNEERWCSDEVYPSREAAIAELTADRFDEFGDDVLYVGKRADIDLTFTGFADMIEEKLALEADDQVGEVADGWPEFSTEQHEALDEALAEVIETFVRRYIKRTIFKVVDVSSHHREDHVKVVAE